MLSFSFFCLFAHPQHHLHIKRKILDVPVYGYILHLFQAANLQLSDKKQMSNGLWKIL